MKKIKLLIVLLFVFLIGSPFVYAEGTTKYYIEANIQSNGDMQVKELKELDGQYNGFSTNLRFKNPNLRTFMGVKEDFEGSTIYNGTDITDLKVYDVIKSTNNFKPLSLEDINSVINQEPEKEAPKQEKDNVQVSDIPNENINIDSAPLTIDEINNVLELSQGNVEAKPKRGM